MGLFEIPSVLELGIRPHERVQSRVQSIIRKKKHFFFAVHGGVRLDETFSFFFLISLNPREHSGSNLKFWWKVTSLITNLHAWDIFASCTLYVGTSRAEVDKEISDNSRNLRRNCIRDLHFPHVKLILTRFLLIIISLLLYDGKNVNLHCDIANKNSQ